MFVTGAFGWTARAIIEAFLRDGHQVVGLDLPNKQSQVDLSYFAAVYQGTISNYDFVKDAIAGCDVAIHLAVAIGDVYRTPEIPFDVNVRGMANVMEASRIAGIERVILISSAPVHVGKHDIGAVDDCLQKTGSDFLYDLTKCLQEDIGRYYANTFGMSVITLRAGHIVDGRVDVDPKGRSLSDLTYLRGGWVCRYDLARSIQLALNYETQGYDAFHIIGSREAEIRFDMDRTTQLLGFVPETRFEAYPPK